MSETKEVKKEMGFRVYGIDMAAPKGVDSLGKDAISDIHQIMRNVVPGSLTDETLLKWLATNDPLAWRLCYITGQAIFENWFFIGDMEDPPEIKRNLDTKLQKFAKENNLRFILNNWIYAERWGGRSIIVDWSKFKDFNPPYKFDVFDISQYWITWDEVKGVPEFYHVTKKLGNQDREIKVLAKFVTHLSTRVDRFEGISVLDPIYYDLVTAYNMAFSIGQTYYRYGTGFPVYKSITPKTPEQMAKIDTMFKNWHTVLGFVYEGEDEFEFKGVSGAALNPTLYYDVIKGRVATGSGYPKILLEGAEAGALASSETNMDSLTKFIKGLQMDYKEGIEQLLKNSAGFSDNDDWQVVFNNPQISRLEEIQIEEAELMLERKKKGIFDPMVQVGGPGEENPNPENEVVEDE